MHILGDHFGPQSFTLGSVFAFSCLALLCSSVEEEEDREREEDYLKVNTQRTNALRS